MKKQAIYIIRNEVGISPVIGVILMLFLTIVLAGVTVSSVYGDDLSSSLRRTPMASIEVDHIEGGLPNPVRYDENNIYLVHRGGEALMADSTSLLISCEGSAYAGVVPYGTLHYGYVSITYDDLLFGGKLSQYGSRNPDLADGVWSAGEQLVLNGDDSINGSSFSSVSVSIDGISDTSNNYGLKEHHIVTVKVLDTHSNGIISEFECQVTPVE